MAVSILRDRRPTPQSNLPRPLVSLTLTQAKVRSPAAAEAERPLIVRVFLGGRAPGLKLGPAD
jgi:hypothetical protein